MNGTCERYLLRIYGSDNVLRGLEMLGIEGDPENSADVVDTLAIVGADAQRNRIEQCVVRGGAAVRRATATRSASATARATPGGAEHDAVIVDSEITGAQDKGVKVSTGRPRHRRRAAACTTTRTAASRATEGGHVTAIRNVVQLNRLGKSKDHKAENGLLVGDPERGRGVRTR